MRIHSILILDATVMQSAAHNVTLKAFADRNGGEWLETILAARED